jgi:hypothetical protein
MTRLMFAFFFRAQGSAATHYNGGLKVGGAMHAVLDAIFLESFGPWVSRCPRHKIGRKLDNNRNSKH